ncbi:cation:proton antiporter [Geminisphaera colitermitum]|uniref:cation:proton antiporter n=1 Tax=Geminisphaera colitermitum TaxID=1148786 RepID=UPI000196539B|nr:cation:proton antiporter [Geminisphaera colitermitum]
MQNIGFLQDMAVILVVAGVVGWFCKRIGVSAVAGYLFAGILVGPYTPPLSLVMSEVRIGVVVQIGMVVLMFSLGLRLSVTKLRRMGTGMFVAVLASAGIFFYLARVLGSSAGLSGLQNMFLAGALLVSSSIVVSRVLGATGTSHERSGQLALGFTLLEDLVGVLMLAVLTSVVKFSDAAAGGTGEAQGAGPWLSHGPELGTTLGHFGAFIVLAGIVGLLLVPWLLRRMSVSASTELQTLMVAGALFGVAVIAERAGYSLALGAFLLGMIVAETPQRVQVERTFAGMRDVLGAVFFVAVGMQVDPALLAEAWLQILGFTVFALVVRTLAPAAGLLIAGAPQREALRAGLQLVPIGEFSFIIAQLGVLSGVMPERFFPAVVGVSLLTTLAAPVLGRHSEGIAMWALSHQPVWLAAWIRYYRGWLERMRVRRQESRLWQLSRKRFIQIGVEAVFVTGVLLFADQLFDVSEQWLGKWLPFTHAPAVIFWLGLCLLLLAPLVALWRNIGALAIIYAQVSVRGHPHAARLTPVIVTCIKIIAGMAMFVWLAALLPGGGGARWVIASTVVFGAGALFLLRRKLIYWHSELEVELQGMLEKKISGEDGAAAPWLRTHREWNLRIGECVLPDLAQCQGKTLAELQLRTAFGCIVVSIERQGAVISLPSPDTALYPLDRVLLLGTPEQIRAGRHFLTGVSGEPAAADFESVSLDTVLVPEDSHAAGRALRELEDAGVPHMQVAGIHRGRERILNPGPDEVLLPGDELLVLGAPDKIRKLGKWLATTEA